MHLMIRAMVYAKNEKQAVGKATGIFEQLTDGQKPFDYYSLYDGGTPSETEELDLRKETPTAVPYAHPNGKQLVDTAFEYTKQQFAENVAKLKALLSEYSADELMEDRDLTLARHKYPVDFRHTCNKLGQYVGNEVRLYDQDGEGIRDQRHLTNVIEKWKCLDKRGEKNPYEGLDLWVVPADVHY